MDFVSSTPAVGDFIARTVGDQVEVVQADERIAVSPELLADHDERWMRVDGDRMTVCGLHYLATGETYYGCPVYRRVMNEGDL